MALNEKKRKFFEMYDEAYASGTTVPVMQDATRGALPSSQALVRRIPMQELEVIARWVVFAPMCDCLFLTCHIHDTLLCE